MEEETPREEKMLAALRTVREYVSATGGDPYDIDFEHKPNYLPSAVSQAWDEYTGFWDEVNNLGIMP